MYNGGKIIAGLIIFVGLFTFPIFYNMGKTAEAPKPNIDTPEINKMEKKQCVESKEWMKANHMQMLDQWRDSVLRDGNLEYVSNTDGKKYIMSLQNTCMRCHSNKKEFCDKCHTYANVTPYCWTCHIAPKENEI